MFALCFSGRVMKAIVICLAHQSRMLVKKGEKTDLGRLRRYS